MDNLTHLGVGALCAVGIAELARRRRGRQRATAHSYTPAVHLPTWLVVLTGAIAGNFPDIDFVTYFINPLYYDAYWHRGATHSLVLAPLWSLLLAAILWLTLWQRRHMLLLYWMCLAGIGSHILVDVLTSWPTSIGYPISHTRPALGIIFIIDLVVTLTVFTALWAAIYRRKALLTTSLAVLLSWPLFAYTQQQRALTAASDLWTVEQRTHNDNKPELRAWAQPFSVFHWKIVAPTEQGFEVTYLRMFNRPVMRSPVAWIQQTLAAYQPIDQANWETRLTFPDRAALDAWQHPDMYAVRDFMTYPVFYQQSDGCVWFHDMLFALPRLAEPFVYGACETDTGIEVKRLPNQPPWAD